MMGKTHRLVSAGTASVLAAGVGMPAADCAVFVGASWCAAKLPDKLERGVAWLMPWRWRIRSWRFTVKAIEHREMTHWIVTAFAFALVAGADVAILLDVRSVALLVAAGAVIGWLMHEVADAMTLDGDPLLGPWSERHFHLLPDGYQFRTGSKAEKRFALVCVAALVFTLAAMVHPAVAVAVGTLAYPPRRLVRRLRRFA